MSRVAPCGEGTWGDIPVDASTQFVDQTYPGGDSDGTREKPWTTIQRAITAAASGAIVAVAAGTYAEDVVIAGKAVRLWGRCPAQVEIQGRGLQIGAVWVLRSLAGGTEIRSLTISGARSGIALSGARDVVFEAVWVRETGSFGIVVDDFYGPTSVVVKSSLVEQNHQVGVSVLGSDATIEASVVKGTLPNADGAFGRGISVQNDPGERAKITVRACLVEQNHELGVSVSGADATIEASVVRDTKANGDGTLGDGIAVANGTATIQNATVSGNARAGVASFGSQVKILDTTLFCNAFDLNGETLNGAPASFGGSRGWRCTRRGAEDCADTEDRCVVETAHLEPPPPPPPLR
jgi:Protein of unknown function (DUF1565)